MPFGKEKMISMLRESELDSDDDPSNDIRYIRRWYFPDTTPAPTEATSPMYTTSGNGYRFYRAIKRNSHVNTYGLHKAELYLRSSVGKFGENISLQVGDSFDAIQHLFPSSTHYLIRRIKGGQVEQLYAPHLERTRYVLIFTFYIPIMKEDSIADLCCHLNGMFTELAKEKYDFQVVLVARMRPDFPTGNDNYNNKNKVVEVAFDHFLSGFSPLFRAVPISDSARSLDLFELSGSSCYGLPGCIVADLEKQKVVINYMSTLLEYGIDLYPFTTERLLQVMAQNIKMPLATLLHCNTSDVLDCACCGSSCRKRKLLSSLTKNVVFIYYLCDGRFMEKLCDLYKQCKANPKFEFELIVVRAGYLVKSPSVIPSFLEKSDYCGWLLLSFKDRVSRRLYNLCNYPSKDKLVVIGPNSSYMDPRGKHVYTEYGINVYPFTKQAVCDNEFDRVRGLSLQECLRKCGIHSVKLDGQIIPVSDLQGTDVLVYFGAVSYGGKFIWDWNGQLVKWVNQMKADPKRKFRFIFFCYYVEDASDEDEFSYLDGFCSAKRWFLPVSDEERHISPLADLLFGKFRMGMCENTLVAFGPNGQLLRLGLERSLKAGSKPATFPESNDALRANVEARVNARL